MKYFNRYILSFLAAISIFTPNGQGMNNPQGQGPDAPMRSPEFRRDPKFSRFLEFCDTESILRVNRQSLDRGTSSLMAAAEQNYVEGCRILLDRGACPEMLDRIGQNLMHYAAKGDNEYIIQRFASQLDPNKQSREYKTPLMLATMSGKMLAIGALLSIKAVRSNLNIVDEDGNSAILIAILNNQLDAAWAILRAGADKDIFNKDGLNALLITIQKAEDRKYLELSEALISNGANVNVAIRGSQWTPLHFATSKNMPDLIILLITRGASKDAKTYDHKFPVHIAKEVNANGDIISMLVPDPTTPQPGLFSRTRTGLLSVGRSVLSLGHRKRAATTAQHQEDPEAKRARRKDSEMFVDNPEAAVTTAALTASERPDATEPANPIGSTNTPAEPATIPHANPEANLALIGMLTK